MHSEPPKVINDQLSRAACMLAERDDRFNKSLTPR